MRSPVRILAALLLAAVSSQAAYHYVHYPSRTNFTPIYEKFNLSALPNNTVSVFVQDQGPVNYAPNDTFGSVLAQIRQAAAAWNSVSASDLRVAFGGLETYTANPTVSNPGASFPGSNTPGIDVVFVDTPGLLGMGAPTTSTVQAQSASGPFFPIVRGLVMLSRDTSNPSGPGPSYTEKFFTTAVHEIGHALGLQHTWTSSAMSQDIIRNTSRARAVDADDIASLATLYGPQHLQQNYGSISGRVTFQNNGQGVALASVVAIATNGPAVSTLTNPDGTYQIVGLPAGFSYLVYAHPLPPDAIPADNSGLRLPVDPNFQPFAASGSFFTAFNAGSVVTQDPARATSYSPTPNNPATVNFAVQARIGVPAYDLQTYSRYSIKDGTYYWPGDATVTNYPAFIDVNKNAGVIIVGPATATAMPTPQSVTMLGFTPATVGASALPMVIPYPDGSAIAIYYSLPLGTGIGPRHLVFNFGSDIYVLPYSVDLVDSGPPSVTSLAPNGDGTVTVTGTNLGPDSRIFFDAMQALQAPFSGNNAQGSITVTPPQAASGQVSTVTVYDAEGQNSLILTSTDVPIPSAAPPTYTYPATGSAQIFSVTPASLPAGNSAAVDIIATGTNFVDGQVSVGFGSDDVTVRRVWVLTPTHLVANVVVAPNAAIALSEVSIVSGMQVLSQPNAFQVQPLRAGVPSIALPVLNALTGAEQLVPGPNSFGTIYGQNLGTFGATTVTLNGQAANVIFDNGGQVNFAVPSGFPAGPASLVLTTGGASTLPVMVQVYASVPAIVAVSLPNLPVSVGTLLSPGDTINLTATGLDPSLANGFVGRVRVTIAGVDMAVQQVNPIAGGSFQIQVVITQSFGASQVPLTLIVDGSSSAPVTVAVK
jgi:uncharacterized protein (TIGR03437 family)